MSRDDPPEDPVAEEASEFVQLIYERPELQGLTDQQKESLSEWLWREIGDAYARGYSQGQCDEALARDYEAGLLKL